MGDELLRWARDRAPHVVARAEAEAVAVLRDAIVTATVGARAPAAARPEANPPPAAEHDELVWTYCVVESGTPLPEGLTGIAGSTVQCVSEANLAAVVCRVPGTDFDEEPLRRNLNDLAWLERVARAHEQVLDRMLPEATLVPLRICTLYENEDGVRAMLDRERDHLAGALETLEGREEWGVKLLLDRERLMRAAREVSEGEPNASARADAASGGAAYMLQRREERRVRELADSLAADLASQVHAQLERCAIGAVTRPPQNRELSGHEGEMLLNAAYLVERDRVAGMRDLVGELEARHADLGARLELTGPWPPYNFVPGETAAGIA
ncbi:MAG TPA: GvpL/GvpF family gas vesicle protein [Thermoleophilaceae bacterium]|nr:GvpL/GvpF family gas vesicle protein [Thermoleophilaceae bacterium]